LTLKDLEKRVQTLEDVEEIKKLHQKYMDLMDYIKYEEVLELFTEDGTSEVRSFGIKRGKTEMAEVYLGVLGKRRGTVRKEGHMAVHPNITVNGDTARGTWLIYMLFSVPTLEWVQGVNEAEYRKVDGVWKISKMKFTRTLASKPELYP
jgi:hypothetical protein